MKVAVSGVRGFVGGRLQRTLEQRNIDTVGLVRAHARTAGEFAIGDLSEEGPLNIPPVDALIHLAARVHVMQESDPDPLAAYRLTNVLGTRRLLEAARRAGVTRFIYVSTIKVLGEETAMGSPFTQDAEPHPQDPYAISKLEGECQVIEYCERHAIEWTIVRPVLVYGPGVGGNFAQLLRLIAAQTPLPLRSVSNERSFLYVDNLCAFLAAAICHPYLAGRTINLADPPAWSTPDLIRSLATAMNRRARLLPLPVWVLEFAGKLTRREAAVRRLTRSLHVDTTTLFQEMRWHPPISWNVALQETTADVIRGR